MSSNKSNSKSTDADDVLDFINSLPESKINDLQNEQRIKSDQTDNKDELLGFLDELTTTNSNSNSISNEKSRGKFEPKNKKNKSKEELNLNNKEEEIKKNEESKDLTNDKESEIVEVKEKEKEDEEEEEINIDPIGSISTWWNKEGSNKVSSIWGSITSNAVTISETTFQIASNTSNQISQQRQKFLNENNGGIVETEQILNILNKLNSILINMSQQIKDGLINDDDELLNILLIYDLNNLNYLDKLCFEKFNKVMNQVEGGIKVSVNNFNHKNEINNNEISKKVQLNMFNGKIIDGEKLCFANLDSSIKDYIKILQLEEESKKIDENENENESTNNNNDHNEKIKEINKSNLFISIQPITTNKNDEENSTTADEKNRNNEPIFIESNNSNSFSFTLILKDITNDITIITKTQSFPLKWSRWLSGDIKEFKSLFNNEDEDEGKNEQENKDENNNEEEDDNNNIGIEPSEWVKDWIKDGLSLSFAVLAQEYVVKRMGI